MSRYHHVAHEELPDNMTRNHAATMSNAEDVKATKLLFPRQSFEGIASWLVECCSLFRLGV
jgi:hypothetical protein